MAGFRRNHRLEWIGITGCFASEYAVKEFWDRGYVRDTRKRFAETANEVLERTGCPVRYDARSYKDMGLDIEPVKHVARILTDKSKIHDFVVMDPEWTRRMIEQEMNAAAVERDKTYVELKKVEKRLEEVSRSITRLTDANAKLPKQMKLSPLSRMTVTTAKQITRRMLLIEQERIEQRFADEATARTIQHVIDATAPTSGHRDGKERRAKPMDGANAPDARAMAHLHEAATEEMRLHRIATAGRLRSLGLRAAAAYEQWRAEADPPLQAGSLPQEARPQPSPATAPHQAMPQAESSRPSPAVQAQPAPTQATPGPKATPAMSPLESVIAMAPNASERMRQGIANTMARMQASTQALLQSTNGPEELAEAVIAMIAHIPPATRTPADQAEKAAERAAAVERAGTDPFDTEATADRIDPAEGRPPEAQSLKAVAPARPTAEPTQAQPATHRSFAEAVRRQPGQAAPRSPTQTATTARTQAPSAQSQIRRDPEAATMLASKPLGSQTTMHVAGTAKTAADLLEKLPGPTPTSSDARHQHAPISERPTLNTTTTNATGSASSTNDQPQALTPAPSASVSASPDMPSTNVATLGVVPPPAIPKEIVPANIKADDAAAKEDRRSEHARRVLEAARVEEEARAEKTKQADAWAAKWIDGAPKSDMDPGRISWVISSHLMRRDEPLQTMTNFIERHPKLELAYRSLALGYSVVGVDAAAMKRLLTRVAPSDRDTWNEIGIACLNAHQVNLAKQQRDVEASAWANAWIAQAPRFILTLDHLTWTLSGDAQEDSVFGKLFGLLHRNSKMDIRPNRTERELIVPIELLRAVLETVAPQHREQWDHLGDECARASKLNDDHAYRKLEEVMRVENTRAMPHPDGEVQARPTSPINGAAQQLQPLNAAETPSAQITSWLGQVQEALGTRDGVAQVTLFARPKEQGGAVNLFYSTAHQLRLGGAYPGPPSQALRWSRFVGQVVKLGSPMKDGPDDGQAEAVFG